MKRRKTLPSTARQKEWYQENLHRERSKKRAYAKLYRSTNKEKTIWSAAKNRAAIANLAFDIEVSDIIIPILCPILKQPLKANSRYAPSLDRIKPELGYVKGNVWIISRKANVMKNDASFNELQEFANWVKTFQPL